DCPGGGGHQPHLACRGARPRRDPGTGADVMSQPYARLHGAAISAPDESSGFVERSGPGGRARRLLGFLRFVSGLALVVGVAVAVALSVRHSVTTSPRFALEHLEVVGGKRLGAEQVRRIAGIEP